jgi:Domain of unknown function (DUF4160)
LRSLLACRDALLRAPGAALPSSVGCKSTPDSPRRFEAPEDESRRPNSPVEDQAGERGRFRASLRDGRGRQSDPDGRPPLARQRPGRGITLDRRVQTVPRISVFYGIAIWMYWNEGRHARPHFHARYAESAASIDLDGEVIAGELPGRAVSRDRVARLHRDELEANWERARREEPLQPIDPLP